MTNTNEELNLDEITSDVIKNELIRVVKSRLLSDNIKISIEHGSKKGMNFSEKYDCRDFLKKNIHNSKNQVTILLVRFIVFYTKTPAISVAVHCLR